MTIIYNILEKRIVANKNAKERFNAQPKIRVYRLGIVLKIKKNNILYTEKH